MCPFGSTEPDANAPPAKAERKWTQVMGQRGLQQPVETHWPWVGDIVVEAARSCPRRAQPAGFSGGSAWHSVDGLGIGIGSSRTPSVVFWGQPLKQRPSQTGRGLTFSDFSSQTGSTMNDSVSSFTTIIAGPRSPVRASKKPFLLAVQRHEAPSTNPRACH